MRLKYLIATLLTFTVLITASGQPKELLEKGNSAYMESKYPEAIEFYNKVVSQGYSSATLFYNLGNAYYKTNQIGYAILNYERAKLLAPANENIDYNLNIAKMYVVDKIEVLPTFFVNRWVNNLINTMSSDGWAILTAVLLSVFLVVGIVYFWSGSRGVKKSLFFAAIFLLVLSVFSTKFAFNQKNKVTDHDKAIIFSHSVTLKSSPDESGTNLFLLHEGLKVEVTDKVGEWLEIRVSDGNKGWLKSSEVEII